MFLKCRSRENENKSQRTERGFFSQQTNIQKPLPFCTQLFLFERYRSILKKHISVFSQPPKAQNRAASYYFCTDPSFLDPNAMRMVSNDR
jgi:hypothetical protein